MTTIDQPLTVTDLTPGSPAWRGLITASKVAAILGVSPYASPRSVWNLMAGIDPGEGDSAVKRRGHYLEPAILAWWADQHPEYDISRRQVIATRPDLTWGAATLDALAVPVVDDPDLCPLAVVEAKSSDKDEEWGRPGTDEIPAYYAAQAIWGMHLSGAPVAYVPIITSHLEFREYVVAYDADLAADIEARCAVFYASLGAAQPPELDDHTATYESLRRVHPDIERDTEMQITPDLARRYVLARAAQAEADAQFTGAKSALIEALGTAHRAKCGDQTIAQRQNTASGVAALYPSRKAVNLDALPTTERTAA